ncbi:MAG: hypothetical protein HUJ30_01930 [Gammaproteobacteria bacterium]|nr:hypothetical protein [Gammaproteobacteria bacterium]
MVRPSKSHYSKLQAIAAVEDRRPGTQATRFLEEAIDNYVEQHPEVAEQLSLAS